MVYVGVGSKLLWLILTIVNLNFFRHPHKSISNDNANHVPPEMRFKFVDDLSTLVELNVILTGLSSYNFKLHVASDVGIDQKFLPSQNTQSQQYLDQIENWTHLNKSKWNVKNFE